MMAHPKRDNQLATRKTVQKLVEVHVANSCLKTRDTSITMCTHTVKNKDARALLCLQRQLQARSTSFQQKDISVS